MKEQIKHQIRGNHYILFSIPVKKEQTMNRLYRKIEETKSILRGSDEVVQGTLWSSTIVTLSVLVPEHKVKIFSDFLINL